MGSGSWTSSSFATYSTTKGYTLDSFGNITTSASNQEMFKARRIDPTLSPFNAMRECLDSEEHPETLPVILALDVTGSMGQAAVEVAKKLNAVMTSLYDNGKDIEFMIMGIGDLYCDDSPIQISQFESDIRIAEQLDKVWFEFGGGGNSWESYTAAWYMGSRHCELDCWKRGKKGIIITIGDERLNPCLQKVELSVATGDNVQDDIETKDLYSEVIEKYDVYHINVNHGRNYDYDNIVKSFGIIGNGYKEASINNITDVIIEIVSNNESSNTIVNHGDGISW